MHANNSLQVIRSARELARIDVCIPNAFPRRSGAQQLRCDLRELRKLRVGSLRNTSISRGFPTTAVAAVAAAISM